MASPLTRMKSTASAAGSPTFHVHQRHLPKLWTSVRHVRHNSFRVPATGFGTRNKGRLAEPLRARRVGLLRVIRVVFLASRPPPLALRNSPPCPTGSGWQELSSRVQQWSEQPCVRPVSAVHMTAGHNALRGSGPGHNHAFDHAVAQVGCPDRRIDRLCITCCSPSQPFPSRRMLRHDLFPGLYLFQAFSFRPLVRPVPCSAHPWSLSPRPCERSCWRVR